ncbi:stage II sporulation protein D [Allobacillus sp. GCM10007491]|uniref:Stage II sporulation protein D n=1 Tax=Allobacillus saliphilus TaxID=2912308 RepID=A0A941CVX1_9BACI|nr:stage II sporulation protein D [Allobacillus saliphilus]
MKKVPIILVATLLSVILILPTILVMPFAEASTKVNEQEESEPVTQEETPSEEPIVSVFREETELVEEVPLEEYVALVVASEMPMSFEKEAIKAQALAARTYIVKKMLTGSEEAYDVTDTVNDQVFKSEEELREDWGVDFSEKFMKLQQAVKETKGQIITYEGTPITAQFFSTSNGYTENAEDYWQNEIPYLKSVSSPWDEASPEFSEQEVIAMNKVAAQLDINASNNLTVSNVKRTQSGRIAELTINGKSFSGREVREALGLRSNDFTIEKKNDYIIFKTQGYGHGVGMSQYGANGMAREGKTYQDIVKHYYQGIDIQTLEEVM